MADKRQALSNVEGEVELRGDLAFRVPLGAAMAAQAEEAEPSLTHAFHTYPARMHPAVARVVLDEFFMGAGSEVLDPFCGGGTVPVEALVRGWRCLGSDLDPLAIRLSRVKTERRRAKARTRFLDALGAVAAASTRRVRGRVDVRAKLSAAERSWYQVHVLKELAGLLEEIRAVRDERDRLALEMVFSAIVVKFSRQRSETAQHEVDKRIRKGLVTEFFHRKGEELVAAWTELSEALPSPHHAPRFVLSDARKLAHTLSGEYRCDLVLSSPPYGGTYDYVRHHARRHAWLGINPKQLERHEIGARRHGSRGKKSAAIERWDREVSGVLRTLATVLRPEGIAVLLVGDGEIAGRRIAADRQLETLAPRYAFELLAVASQPRPDWRGGMPRREHLVALRRTREILSPGG